MKITRETHKSRIAIEKFLLRLKHYAITVFERACRCVQHA